MAVDPGRLAARLGEVGGRLLTVSGVLAEILDAADAAQRTVDAAVDHADRSAVRARNRVADTVALLPPARDDLATVEDQVESAATAARHAGDIVAQAEVLVGRHRATWERRASDVHRRLTDVKRRLALAGGKKRAALLAEQARLVAQAECCDEAVAACRDAAGLVGAAGYRAGHARESVDGAAGAFARAAEAVDAAERAGSEASGVADSAGQLAMQSADAAGAARQARVQASDYGARADDHARRATDDLADAADRLRALDQEF